MKNILTGIIQKAAAKAYENGALKSNAFPDVVIEEPKMADHGDLATNFAMVSASVQKMPPRKIAEAVLANLADEDGIIEKTEIAGPGFINFFIRPKGWRPILDAVHTENENYGRSDMGNSIKYQVEFVSSNPTGPLHVGHGRGAAVGDALSNLLSFAGYDVSKEYYINDSGRQIRTLGTSVYLRYKAIFGDDASFPEECYQGDYIKDLAADVKRDKGDTLLPPKADEETGINYCARYACGVILEGMRQDLITFGVTYDVWFSEQSLYDDGQVEKAIEDLGNRGILYEQDGALWFRTTDYGDEKDRVVKRNNGLTTYFASDIAYHKNKYDRGFDHVIDVWGSDHHGYIPRMKAAVEAVGVNPDRFEVTLIQFVNLLRGGVPVGMSTRAGEFVTLIDVINEVGRDAARFMFLSRHHESPLDFDLEVAKQKTNDNPVYYVQYVHARITSIAKKAMDDGYLTGDANAFRPADDILDKITEPEEIKLIKTLARYPEVIEVSAKFREPHRVTYYLLDLASDFHTYYNKHRVLSEDKETSLARLYLVLAVRKVIRNGLMLMGVSAPESM